MSVERGVQLGIPQVNRRSSLEGDRRLIGSLLFSVFW
jgi:hypothetical protein